MVINKESLHNVIRWYSNRISVEYYIYKNKNDINLKTCEGWHISTRYKERETKLEENLNG